MTFYVPLDPSRRLDRKGRRPWLGQGLWGDEEGLFELRLLVGESDDFIEIAWSDGGETLIELGRAPIRIGGVIRLVSTEDPKNLYWDYVVRDVARV